MGVHGAGVYNDPTHLLGQVESLGVARVIDALSMGLQFIKNHAEILKHRGWAGCCHPQ